MRNRELLYLKKIQQTLKKIEDQTYGLCDECGCEIKFQRLWARPTAEMCIICKEDSERSEQGHISSRKSKSMGESINLAGV